MKLNLSVLILLAVLGSEAAGQESEFATGRAYYTEGEFKKAVAHFQLALKVNPSDAESYHWMGMSYQVLADIAFPFADKLRPAFDIGLLIILATKPEIAVVGCNLFGCCDRCGVGDAEPDVARFQYSENFIVEPRPVAKLKRRAH